MTISHKVELISNNKHKTYFRMAFGCARKAYNWTLEKRQDYYRQGIRVSCLDLKKEFNAVKKEQFPYVCEVSKHLVQQPFLDLNNAFMRFFKKLGGYTKFKKKRDGEGSFYIGGESVKLITDRCRQYLKIPKLEKVKMTEPLRFSGKINHVRIRQDGDKYFASFSVNITEDEFYRTHKTNAGAGGPVGIDVGLKALAALSSGVAVLPVKDKLDRLDKRSRKLQRRLGRRKRPIDKGGKTPKSNNFKKLSRKLRKVHSRKKTSGAIICTRRRPSLSGIMAPFALNP